MNLPDLFQLLKSIAPTLTEEQKDGLVEAFRSIERRAEISERAIIQLNRVDVDRLRTWLERPSGALTTDTDMHHLPRRGITFEAVEGGSIWIRLSPRG